MRANATCAAVLACVLPHPAGAAELEERTVEAYERYIAEFAQRFATQSGEDDRWIDQEEFQARLRTGEVAAAAGHEDGIIDLPNGLLHHWRSAIFIPGVALEDVTNAVLSYSDYADIYDWVIGSRLLARERDEGGREHYRVVLRLERSAGPVSSVVDLWTMVEYRYLNDSLATAVSNADCVREVENPGEPDERRLARGAGAGYLWRANTFATYLERDDGVYVELETMGLSRAYPPLLGWIIEPFARNIGRGSAAESLKQLRRAIVGEAGAEEPDGETVAVDMPAFWCVPGDAAGPGAERPA